MCDKLEIYVDSLYMMFYGGATIACLLASVYLLFRRANIFSPSVTPPLCLRRSMSAFFAVLVLSHVWWFYMVKYYYATDPWLSLVVASGLDSVTIWPTMMVMLLSMLQDRKLLIWPVLAATAPIALMFAVIITTRNYALVLWVQAYLYLMIATFSIYMVFAVKRYGRWLRDNYADLEHKEVWQSLMVLGACLLVFNIYLLASNGKAFQYGVQVIDYVFVFFLLWRVETLQALGYTMQASDEEETTAQPNNAPTLNIGELLEEHCVGRQLYLRPDISLVELSKTIGTNRFYLSQYFTRQETTYNAYINRLRIEHFVRLYHEALVSKRDFTAQQLAQESGFRSYSTFGMAFKLLMGQTVTAWMRDSSE